MFWRSHNVRGCGAAGAGASLADCGRAPPDPIDLAGWALATTEDTLEVVTLAAEEVQPRLSLPRAVTGLNTCQTDGDAQPSSK
jgi:hypothetical protein